MSSLRAQGDADSPMENAGRFLDFLAEAGFGLWQMLPVHPPDEYGSPYRTVSVHAGDAGMIDPDGAGLRVAHRRFREEADGRQQEEFETFRRDMQGWLEDYAVYSAIKRQEKERPWWRWPPALRRREPEALEEVQRARAGDIAYYRFEQFLFFQKWRELRRQAEAAGILLLGDMPLYPAHDSADVWAHQRLFQLHADGSPQRVAGVPPDYFSATGQRWGNPVYDWEALAEEDWRWWIDRIRTQLVLFDLIRLDHFRGLEAVWEVPAEAETAEEGEWRHVPGRDLLETLHRACGGLPFVAEDLGTITPAVKALRRDFGLPGMKVLQFAFGDDSRNPYLPHNHARRYVVYTGTHDNNTTLGWFGELDEARQDRVMEYLGRPAEPMPWPLIRAALASVCRLAVLPMQDLLGLGGEHRLNTPGTTAGNWAWRLPWPSLTPKLAQHLRHLNQLYGR
ncbi:MAG: 4-alpha-glucanotransferase [Gammaproteobacteria bacterium]